MCYRVFLVMVCLLSGVIVQGQERYRINTQDTASIQQRIDRIKAYSRQYPDSAMTKLRLLLQQSQLTGYSDGTRKCLMELAVLLSLNGKYEMALSYAQQGLQLCDSNVHRNEMANLYNNIGIIYNQQARFQQAYEAFLSAERFALGNPVIQAKTWNNMATVLKILGYPDRALRYLNKAVTIAIREQNGNMWASLLLNLHNTYSSLEETEKQSYLFIDSAIAVAKAYQEYPLLHTAIVNKGIALLESGRAKEALALLNESDSLSDYLALTPQNQQHRYKVMGMAYLKLDDYRQAEKNLLLAGKGMNERDWFGLAVQLTELYVAMGDYKKAYQVYRQYKEKEDSLGSNTMRLQVNELETRYRTAEKDKALADQRLLLAAKTHQVKLRTIWLCVIGGGSLLLVGLLVALYRNMRHKQRLLGAQQENIRLKALMEGEEQERIRISGELHDGIGGILSAAKMSFSGLKLSQEGNTQKYTHGVQLLDEAYKELRRTAHNLSPLLLRKEGLIAAVSAFCDKIALAYKSGIRFQHFGGFNSIPEELVLTAYRIIQELVHNAIKHAQADLILVQLSRGDRVLNITVEDDGRGMSDQGTSGGIGMENVYARVRALQGTMDIDSRAGEGTTVYVQFEDGKGKQQLD